MDASPEDVELLKYCVEFVFHSLHREFRVVDKTTLALYGPIENVVLSIKPDTRTATVMEILYRLKKRSPSGLFIPKLSTRIAGELQPTIDSIQERKVPHRSKLHVSCFRGSEVIATISVIAEIVFRVYSIFGQDCSLQTCPQMDVSPSISYLYTLGAEQTIAPAKYYIHMHGKALQNELKKIVVLPVPKTIIRGMRKTAKILFRILAHICFKHLKNAEEEYDEGRALGVIKKSSIVSSSSMVVASHIVAPRLASDRIREWEWCPICETLIVDRLTSDSELTLHCVYCFTAVHKACLKSFEYRTCFKRMTQVVIPPQTIQNNLNIAPVQKRRLLTNENQQLSQEQAGNNHSSYSRIERDPSPSRSRRLGTAIGVKDGSGIEEKVHIRDSRTSRTGGRRRERTSPARSLLDHPASPKSFARKLRGSLTGSRYPNLPPPEIPLSPPCSNRSSPPPIKASLVLGSSRQSRMSSPPPLIRNSNRHTQKPESSSFEGQITSSSPAPSPPSFFSPSLEGSPVLGSSGTPSPSATPPVEQQNPPSDFDRSSSFSPPLKKSPPTITMVEKQPTKDTLISENTNSSGRTYFPAGKEGKETPGKETPTPNPWGKRLPQSIGVRSLTSFQKEMCEKPARQDSFDTLDTIDDVETDPSSSQLWSATSFIFGSSSTNSRVSPSSFNFDPTPSSSFSSRMDPPDGPVSPRRVVSGLFIRSTSASPPQDNSARMSAANVPSPRQQMQKNDTGSGPSSPTNSTPKLMSPRRQNAFDASLRKSGSIQAGQIVEQQKRGSPRKLQHPTQIMVLDQGRYTPVGIEEEESGESRYRISLKQSKGFLVGVSAVPEEMKLSALVEELTRQFPQLFNGPVSIHPMKTIFVGDPVDFNLSVRLAARKAAKWLLRSGKNETPLKIQSEKMSRVDHRRALWSWVRDLDSNILDRVCSEEGEVIDHKRRNIYHILCESGRYHELTVALEKKINVNPMGNDVLLQQPIHYACGFAHFRCAEALLRKGVDAGSVTIERQSALHLLVANEKIESDLSKGILSPSLVMQVFSLLVKQGCNPHLRDDEGRSPLSLCLDRKNYELLKYLAMLLCGIATTSVDAELEKWTQFKTAQDYDEVLSILVSPKIPLEPEIQRSVLLFSLDREISKLTSKKNKRRRKVTLRRTLGKKREGGQEEGEFALEEFECEDITFEDDCSREDDYFDPSSADASGYSSSKAYLDFEEEEEEEEEEDEEDEEGEERTERESFDDRHLKPSPSFLKRRLVFLEQSSDDEKSEESEQKRERFVDAYLLKNHSDESFISENESSSEEDEESSSLSEDDEDEDEGEDEDEENTQGASYLSTVDLGVETIKKSTSILKISTVGQRIIQTPPKITTTPPTTPTSTPATAPIDFSLAYTTQIPTKPSAETLTPTPTVFSSAYTSTIDPSPQFSYSSTLSQISSSESASLSLSPTPTKTTSPTLEDEANQRNLKPLSSSLPLTKENNSSLSAYVSQVPTGVSKNLSADQYPAYTSAVPPPVIGQRAAETTTTRAAETITTRAAQFESYLSSTEVVSTETPGETISTEASNEKKKNRPTTPAGRRAEREKEMERHELARKQKFRLVHQQRMIQKNKVASCKYGAPLKSHAILRESINSDNWIERFQVALADIQKFSETKYGLCVNPLTIHKKHLENLLEANSALIQLEQDFIATAKTYGKIIISERFSETKTIQPVVVGGLAGGEKYIVHNILYKFAVDFYGLYDGDTGAAKVAGHELKGVISYFNALYGQEVRLPMIALVDYFGFRLIVMPILPINKSTLIYGSSDGGKTIYAKDEKFNSIMKKAAERINIKSHLCGFHTGRPDGTAFLHSAADVEGHQGTDGHYYLLDFSRVMPPCPPDPSISGSHLFYLFRPEFVHSLEEPLCSDAFSGFVNADPKRKEYNQKAVEAAQLLMGEKCEQTGRNIKWIILEALAKKEFDTFSLIQFIHKEGVNIRFLGIVLSYVDDQLAQAFLMCEIIARIVKNEIRALLRQTMKKIRKPMEASYRVVIMEYLNLVLVEKTEESREYWRVNLKKLLIIYYNVGSPFVDPNFEIRGFIDRFGEPFGGRKYLLQRIAELSSLVISPLAVDRCLTYQRFELWDVEGFTERVKHMNIIADTQGTNYTLLGLQHLQNDDVTSANFYLKLAEEKFTEALRSNPTNPSLLEHMAICLAGRAIISHILDKKLPYTLRKQDWPLIQLDTRDPELQKVDNMFLLALDANHGNTVLLSLYSGFLMICNRMDKAEIYFYRLFKKNLRDVRNLTAYSNLMAQMGQTRTADLVKRRIEKLKKLTSFFDHLIDF